MGSQDAGSDSDVFDEKEWEQSQRALINRELYTGLTFFQRARLRQQLVKGDLVDVPNMMQRYGPAPAWYTGIDPEDFQIGGSPSGPSGQGSQIGGSSNGAPVSNYQVGGSSSSSGPSGLGLPVGESSNAPQGQSCRFDVGEGTVDRQGAVDRQGVVDWHGVLVRHAGVLLAFVGQSPVVWLSLRRVNRTSWDSSVLRVASQLQDSGVVPGSSGLGFEATFRFVQVGDQFCWVPVEVTIGSHTVDAGNPEEGARVLGYLGHRSVDWQRLCWTAAHLRIAVLCAVVEELRAGPLALYFQVPSGLKPLRLIFELAK